MYLLHPYLVKYVFPTASEKIPISQLHWQLVSWNEGKVADEVILEILRLKKVRKLTARRDHRDTRGSHTLGLSRRVRVTTGPLCGRVQAEGFGSGSWAACSAEQRGVSLTGLISFIPGDTLPGAAADQPHTRLHVWWQGTGQWETSAQRDEPRAPHLKPRPSTFKSLTRPFWSSPFKYQPFLWFSLFPTFLELSHRGSIPTSPGQTGCSPWPICPCSAPGRQRPLLSTVVQTALLYRSCAVCWALGSLPCPHSALKHAQNNQALSTLTRSPSITPPNSREALPTN